MSIIISEIEKIKYEDNKNKLLNSRIKEIEKLLESPFINNL